MKKISVLISIFAFVTGIASAQNLLVNGDFNDPVNSATDWTTWSFGQGYANQEVLTTQLINGAINNTGIYDGSLQMTCGATDNGDGGGVYQIVSATAGVNYDLNVEAGAQPWWWPTGTINLSFLDAGNNQLGITTVTTTTSITGYDTGVVYQDFDLTAVAPVGTTQAKVEFKGYGGGSCWFDDASLTVVPEPSTLAMLAVGSVGFFGWRRISRRA